MRGTSRHPSRALTRALATVAAAFAAALAIAACGGDDSGGQFADEPAGRYDVDVVEASFPRTMRIAQTEDMTLGLRNTGDETVPGMTVVVSLLGPDAPDSTSAFTYRDPQPGLSIPQRPVFLLEEGYPKLADVSGPGGAETADGKTFNFGPVEPGETVEPIWRISAVRPGAYTIGYRVFAGVSGEAEAVGSHGRQPEGAFRVRVIERPQKMRVNEQGEIVPVGSGKARAEGSSGSGQ